MNAGSSQVHQLDQVELLYLNMKVFVKSLWVVPFVFVFMCWVGWRPLLISPSWFDLCALGRVDGTFTHCCGVMGLGLDGFLLLLAFR